MFDIGWTELLVIGVVALVVVGPKDLPVMFKTFGRFMARARAMARDFSRAMENAADEAGIKDVAKDIKAATNPVSSGIDRLKDAADRFEKWDPSRPAATKPVTPVVDPAPITPVPAATATSTTADPLTVVPAPEGISTAAPTSAATGASSTGSPDLKA